MDAALTSRVNVLAGMDIADKRRPQDGRLAIKGESGELPATSLSSVSARPVSGTWCQASTARS